MFSYLVLPSFLRKKLQEIPQRYKEIHCLTFRPPRRKGAQGSLGILVAKYYTIKLVGRRPRKKVRSPRTSFSVFVQGRFLSRGSFQPGFRRSPKFTFRRRENRAAQSVRKPAFQKTPTREDLRRKIKKNFAGFLLTCFCPIRKNRVSADHFSRYFSFLL